MRDERLVADVGDPHAALADRDVRRAVADADRRDHAVAVRVDPRDRVRRRSWRPTRRPRRTRRPPGPAPTLIGRPTTLFVRASMRRTLPSTESATHAAPAPTAMPDGSMPGMTVFSRRPVRASTRATREPEARRDPDRALAERHVLGLPRRPARACPRPSSSPGRPARACRRRCWRPKRSRRRSPPPRARRRPGSCRSSSARCRRRSAGPRDHDRGDHDDHQRQEPDARDTSAIAPWMTFECLPATRAAAA